MCVSALIRFHFPCAHFAAFHTFDCVADDDESVLWTMAWTVFFTPPYSDRWHNARKLSSWRRMEAHVWRNETENSSKTLTLTVNMFVRFETQYQHRHTELIHFLSA